MRLPSKQSDRWRAWDEGIRADACAFALILIACGFFFYLHWDFWEDQAAQVYMTWGMFHGMKPYVDLVDPNWPGILLPHTAAYLMAGIQPWGLRAIDLLFAYGLLLSTSIVLAAWGTPLAMRLLAGCAYLTNYFATGWMWTAQRESFCWPLFVISAIPLLLVLGPLDQSSPHPWRIRGASRWFSFGVIAGFSLWIKPSPWPALVAVYAMAALMCDREQRASVIRGIVWHTLGIAAVSVLFICVLAALGELSGFIKWGILYDLGPYSQVKFSWPIRLRWSWHVISDPAMRPLALAMGVVGSVAAFAWPHDSRRWRKPARPIVTALVLVIASALVVLLQGKPSSIYHFIPLAWALAAYAAVIWSVVPWANGVRELILVGAAMVLFVTIYASPVTVPVTVGSFAGERLQSSLGPDDEIVEWGYAPSLLLHAQRRTPLMTFIGTGFLVTSPGDSWAAREVLDRLNVAMRDPAVRYLLVERLPNFRIRNDILDWPKSYLTADPALRKTVLAQYQLLPENALPGFDVYLHKKATMMPRS